MWNIEQKISSWGTVLKLIIVKNIVRKNPDPANITQNTHSVTFKSDTTNPKLSIQSCHQIANHHSSQVIQPSNNHNLEHISECSASWIPHILVPEPSLTITHNH